MTGRLLVAYQVVVVLELGLLFLHSSENGLEGRDQIVEDDGPPLLALCLVEAAGVDDSHLLQHGRLATLSSTCASVNAWY
jgi:hypothetical protein